MSFILFLQDDEIAMDFVAAASNIRSHIFGIPMKSRFTIKCKFWCIVCSLFIAYIPWLFGTNIFCFHVVNFSIFFLAMAGNIIPAIATTNAIISGLIVMEALKILSGNIKKCKSVRKKISVGYLWIFEMNNNARKFITVTYTHTIRMEVEAVNSCLIWFATESRLEFAGKESANYAICDRTNVPEY